MDVAVTDERRVLAFKPHCEVVRAVEANVNITFWRQAGSDSKACRIQALSRRSDERRIDIGVLDLRNIHRRDPLLPGDEEVLAIERSRKIASFSIGHDKLR